MNLGDEARNRRVAKLVAVRHAHTAGLPSDCFRAAVEVTDVAGLAVDEVVTVDLDVTESLRQGTDAVVIVLAATVVSLHSVACTVPHAIKCKGMTPLAEAVCAAVSPAVDKAAFVTVFSELCSGSASSLSLKSVVFDCSTRC